MSPIDNGIVGHLQGHNRIVQRINPSPKAQQGVTFHYLYSGYLCLLTPISALHHSAIFRRLLVRTSNQNTNHNDVCNYGEKVLH